MTRLPAADILHVAAVVPPQGAPMTRGEVLAQAGLAALAYAVATGVAVLILSALR